MRTNNHLTQAELAKHLETEISTIYNANHNPAVDFLITHPEYKILLEALTRISPEDIPLVKKVLDEYAK